MSAEKRKVSTDALETLGTIIDSNAGRDAIHLAVEPCIAGEQLWAGQHIGIVKGRATKDAPKKLGIVDPFLTTHVEEGQNFWLIVYPRQITSLRHVWEHPDFPNEIEIAKRVTEKILGNPDKDWIRDFADSVGLTYKDLMDAAEEWIKHDEYLNRGELLDGHSVPDEFWDHYENVVGHEVQKRGSFFTCSC